MAEKWNVKKSDGKVYGPVDTKTIRRWIGEKRVLANDYITPEGKEEWKLAGTVLIFKDLFRREGGEEEKAHPAEKRCPNCGNMLPPDAIFCVGCGTDLRTGKKVGEVLVTKGKQRRKVTAENLLLTGLIVVGGAGSFFFFKYLHPLGEGSLLEVLIPVVASVVVLACLYFMSRFMTIVVLVKKTPTSKIADIMYPGFFEVHGKVVCPAPEGVYGFKCVYYEYEHYVYRGRYGMSRGGYVRDRYERKYVPFAVKDESGQIGVEPAGAHFEPKLLTQGGGFMEQEKDSLKGITIDDEAYILGEVVQYEGRLQFEKRKGMLPLVISSKPESKLVLLLILRAVALFVVAGLVPFGVWKLLLEIL